MQLPAPLALASKTLLDPTGSPTPSQVLWLDTSLTEQDSNTSEGRWRQTELWSLPLQSLQSTAPQYVSHKTDACRLKHRTGRLRLAPPPTPWQQFLPPLP